MSDGNTIEVEAPLIRGIDKYGHDRGFMGYVRPSELTANDLERFKVAYLEGDSWHELSRKFSLAGPMSAKYVVARQGFPVRAKAPTVDWRVCPQQWARMGSPLTHRTEEPCARCEKVCDGSLMRLQSARIFEGLTTPDVPRHGSGYGIRLCHHCQRMISFSGGYTKYVQRKAEREASRLILMAKVEAWRLYRIAHHRTKRTESERAAERERRMANKGSVRGWKQKIGRLRNTGVAKTEQEDLILSLLAEDTPVDDIIEYFRSAAQ